MVFEAEREVGFSVLGEWVSVFMGLGLGFCVVSSVLGGNFPGFSWDFRDDRGVGCWVFEITLRS